MDKKILNQFIEIFDSYKSAYGLVSELKKDKTGKVQGKYREIKNELTEKQFENHLTGKGAGLRLIALKENCKLRYAALDLDKKCHSSPLIHTIEEIENKILDLQLPLIPCRSKSGDVHIYCFASEDIDADLFMDKMKEWASLLGYGGCEKFPKQTKRGSREDTGLALNLPYYDYENTNRYAIRKGKKLSLEEFIEYAQTSQITQEELEEFSVQDLDNSYDDAPPCLQMLVKEKIKDGGRNHGLFNFGVYYKKKYPDNFDDKIMDANYNYLEPKLDNQEYQNIIKSLSKKDYNYRCNEDPCASYCNKTECLRRKYGIGDSSVGSEMIIDNLTKYISRGSDSVRWYIECLGYRIQLTVDELWNQKELRKKVFNKTNKVMSPMKEMKYMKMIETLASNAITIEDPEDASKEGQFKEIFYDWFNQNNPLPEEKSALSRKKPFLDRVTKRIYFRSPDLFQHLKSKKFNYIEQDIWHVLRENFDGKRETIRAGGTIIRCWSIPSFDFYDHELEDEDKV